MYTYDNHGSRADANADDESANSHLRYAKGRGLEDGAGQEENTSDVDA